MYTGTYQLYLSTFSKLANMDAESRETRGHELFGLNTFSGIAVLLTMLLRCYTRAAIIKAFGLDDWLMVLATVCISHEHQTILC